MDNIKEFKSKSSFEYYINKKITKNSLGSGTEGDCYIGKNNLAYKIIKDDNLILTQYDPDKIITEKDLKLDSFYFPIELFIVNNKVVGYTSRLVKKDLFLNNYINNSFRFRVDDNYITYSKEAQHEMIEKALFEIDFEKLKSAYAKIYNDTIILTNNNIKIIDLLNNLLFDGTNLIAIDTLNYMKSQNSSGNIKILELTLKEQLDNLYGLAYNDHINSDKKMYSYLNKMNKKILKRK